MRLAIFDFDGTLSRVNSYHIYLKWLTTRFSLSTPRIALAIGLRMAGIIGRQSLLETAVAPLKGWSRSEIELLGQRLYALAILPRLNPLALAEMKKRRDAGYQIVVLSGAFDFMLRPFCEAYQIEAWQGARLAFADDVCRGALDGPEFLGEEKARYLKERFPANQVDWEASCAYSDEILDVPMLSLVGSPFLLADATKSATGLPAKFQIVNW